MARCRRRHRADARARRPQGEGQRRRRHRHRREHARRRRAAAGRHRHRHDRPHHRDHQHRCRRPARAGRCGRLHRAALQAEIHHRSGNADRRHHRRARPPLCRHVRHRRRAGRGAFTPPARRPASASGACRSAKEYDKQIDSKFANVKNTGGRDAGSITAAHFIKRFVKDTPWVHLDIAGTGFGSPQTEMNRSWASGWGVRLLDRLVADNYEQR